MTDWFIRRPAVTLARRDSYLLVDPERGNSVLEGVDVESLATVLTLAALPVTRERLHEVTDDETIDRMVELGLIEPCEPPAPAPVFERRCGRLVVGLTGAVGVTAMLDVVLAL